MRCLECGWVPTPGCLIRYDNVTRGPWYCPKCDAILVSRTYNKKESKMKAKIIKKTVIELEKKEVEQLIREGVYRQTGIDVGDTPIQWRGSAPIDCFAWINIEEPLDE